MLFGLLLGSALAAPPVGSAGLRGAVGWGLVSGAGTPALRLLVGVGHAEAP